MLQWLNLTTAVVVSVLAGAPMVFAQGQWHYEVNQVEFRKAFIEQTAVVLGSNGSTRLQFTATQDGKGSTGMIALEFTVAPISRIKGFDFGYFEGPGAPVEGQKLMRVTVTKAGQPSVHMLSLGGWLSAEVNDGFVFSATNQTRDKQGQVRQIITQILQGADSIEVAVIDGSNHAIVLSATFPLKGSQPVFAALVRGI
ncbi:hypothetical protein MELA_02889 [Candidatus Methylomirabilis lanthanidiphila]|uniref:Uncharacterized protein n=1 Tax=Candidatus Methylomirabilis lanthanidiphila TaxID=2211376 RepID=A0A564ZN16_9BACT|nr:hypothetical protein [Candidatus Methylomirabilis lanthanidiphila]VUZ86486.1 hypothetical protein MELA_02889 [Candidatus Methylomirabilis lanthanidiphila]